MTRSTLGASLLLSLVLPFAPVAATAESPPLPRVLPAECERELALSAAPTHLRDGASVYGFGETGYELVREGSNGFACIVNRDDPFSLKPTCFDAEGAATILPKIERVGAWLRAGRPLQSIRADLERAFESGELISPRRPGVAYMLSHYNRPYNPGTGQLGWFPPHLMFYAPGLTNADIGFDRAGHAESRSLPFIGYQGRQGYMIVLAEVSSERQPLAACPAWVNE